MTMTTTLTPSVAFGFRRTAVKAPPRISPVPIGRSGMIPGLGTAGVTAWTPRTVPPHRSPRPVAGRAAAKATPQRPATIPPGRPI